MEERSHTPGLPADAIEMLQMDHQKVKDLFQDYEKAGDPYTKRKVAEQVFVELELHAQLEETVFYPAFEQLADKAGERLVAESLEEHHAVQDLIDELRELDPEDPAFAATFQ
jgi:hypothetical protein